MTTQLSPITVKGDDGNKRCPWCVSDPQYMNYHDTEWGKPITDDQLLYEKLCLEGFQSGLSWLTILRNRVNVREAFQGFDPEVVAQFRSRDITRLMKNEGIVRNRMKIEATIANAKATLNVQDQLGTLSSLIWSFAPTKPKKAPRTLADVPATSPESVAMSKELLKRGFKFVGPTTMYAAMQSLGLVNDHLATCFARNTAK
jgi:DNA-3-methyladenine glycosylase I